MSERIDHYKAALDALERSRQWRLVPGREYTALAMEEISVARAADLAEAQVHATLHLAQTTGKPQIVRVDAP